MSERSFGGIIFPGYAIVFEESKQTCTVLYKTILVFENEFRMVMLVENDLFIKELDLLLQGVPMTLLPTILLDRFQNGHDEISDLQDECFKFRVKRGSPQVIMQIADEVHPTLLLPTSARVIPRRDI